VGTAVDRLISLAGGVTRVGGYRRVVNGKVQHVAGHTRTFNGVRLVKGKAYQWKTHTGEYLTGVYEGYEQGGFPVMRDPDTGKRTKYLPNEFADDFDTLENHSKPASKRNEAKKTNLRKIGDISGLLDERDKYEPGTEQRQAVLNRLFERGWDGKSDPRKGGMSPNALATSGARRGDFTQTDDHGTGSKLVGTFKGVINGRNIEIRSQQNGAYWKVTDLDASLTPTGGKQVTAARQPVAVARSWAEAERKAKDYANSGMSRNALANNRAQREADTEAGRGLLDHARKQADADLEPRLAPTQSGSRAWGVWSKKQNRFVVHPEFADKKRAETAKADYISKTYDPDQAFSPQQLPYGDDDDETVANLFAKAKAADNISDRQDYLQRAWFRAHVRKPEEKGEWEKLKAAFDAERGSAVTRVSRAVTPRGDGQNFKRSALGPLGLKLDPTTVPPTERGARIWVNNAPTLPEKLERQRAFREKFGKSVTDDNAMAPNQLDVNELMESFMAATGQKPSASPATDKLIAKVKPKSSAPTDLDEPDLYTAPSWAFGPSGKMRNIKAMGDEKLLNEIDRLGGKHGKSLWAKNLHTEAKARGLIGMPEEKTLADKSTINPAWAFGPKGKMRNVNAMGLDKVQNEMYLASPYKNSEWYKKLAARYKALAG
jgi:hypothetical protein